MKTRPANKADLKYLWAAYRLGAFDKERFPEGLDRDSFIDRIDQTLEGVSDVHIVERDKPFGVVMVRDDGWRIEPAVTWLPWATVRNKLEGAVCWLHFIRKQRLAFFRVPSEMRILYERALRYGVLHRVGVIPDWYGPERNAMAYATRTVKD